MRIAKMIFVCVLIAGVSIFGFVMLTNICVALFDTWGLEVPDAAQQADTVQYIRDNFIFAFVVMAILPPIYEELFFRFGGVKLLRWVDTKKWWTVAVAASVILVSLAFVYFLGAWLLLVVLIGIIAAFAIKPGENPREMKNIYIIVITAVVFMLYHHSWAQTIYQLIMGVVFAAIYLRTKNIGWTIFIHFINNAFIVIYTGYSGVDTETVTPVNFGTVALSLGLAAAACAIIYNLIKELPNEQKK